MTLPKKKPCCKNEEKFVPWTDGSLLTTYQKEFFEKQVPIERRDMIRPKDTGLAFAGAFDGTSNYMSDFSSKAQQAPVKAIRPQGVEHEKMPFAGHSTYSDTFIKKDVPYMRVRPPHALTTGNSTFDPVTTYRTNFQNRGVQAQTKPVPPRSNAFDKDNTPFSGASTYKADFMAVASGPAVMVRPEMGHSIIPPGRFDGTTTYTTDFVKKAIGPREPRPWAGECTCGSDSDDN